jgi:hypothetical protein
VLPLATPVQQPQQQQLQLAPTIAALNQSCPLRADGQFQSILPVAMGVKRSLTTPSLNNTSDVYSTIGGTWHFWALLTPLAILALSPFPQLSPNFPHFPFSIQT